MKSLHEPLGPWQRLAAIGLVTLLWSALMIFVAVMIARPHASADTPQPLTAATTSSAPEDNGFCLKATHAGSAAWYYSSAGGISTTSCLPG